MSQFKKATKHMARARIALSGPAGSGKTMWSLQWAEVLANGGPVAVIDTERGSASLYADRFGFDVLEMAPPFHPDRLVRALADAEQAGYAVVIIDSLTHFWSGKGGTLEIVDEASTRFKGNTHAAWQVGTPIQQRMVDAIIGHGGHIIATMRSKTEWVMETGQNGRVTPRKVGLAPQQRSDIEFEFTLFMELDATGHAAMVSKTRYDGFGDKVIQPADSTEAAKEFAAWLNTGEQRTPVAVADEPDDDGTIDLLRTQIDLLTPSQREFLKGEWKVLGLPKLSDLRPHHAEAVADLLATVTGN